MGIAGIMYDKDFLFSLHLLFLHSLGISRGSLVAFIQTLTCLRRLLREKVAKTCVCILASNPRGACLLVMTMPDLMSAVGVEILIIL